MRIPSYPPFIVFFDTVAVLLFILVLNQPQSYRIVLEDQTRLIDGARILEKRGEIYFDMNSGEIFPSQADSNRAEFYDVVSCQTLPYCGESVMQRENRFVVIPDRLLSEAARLSYAVSRLGCNGLNIHVFTNGQVDRKKTLAQNPCMKDIAGANQWAESREPSLSARL